jgi:hypothetical protein
MNIFLSMMESRSTSFKLEEPEVVTENGISTLKLKTRYNGCITIISKRMINRMDASRNFPYYFVTSNFAYVYNDSKDVRFEVIFTKNGVMKSILCSFNGNSVAINNLKRLELINDLTLDLSERTLKDMLADVAKETEEIKRVEKLEEILKKHCKSGWPSTLKWVLIVLGVLFMIGGFLVLNKESYEIVNAKQV